MKKIIITCLAVLALFCLCACQKKEENKSNEKRIEPNTNAVTQKPTNEEMYGNLIREYQSAMNEINLEDEDVYEKADAKRELNGQLLLHVALYEKNGVNLTYGFYDIDKNGIAELIVGASGAPAAIYTYDENTSQVKEIFFQSTIERGSLDIYDNGIILSEGSGGAALHYYEFGKITHGTSYEMLESIEEEYVVEEGVEEGSFQYRNATTSEDLAYQSLDEIMNRYIPDANRVEIVNTPIFTNGNTTKSSITEEMAYEGISNYCHQTYDWSASNDNSYPMYVEMGEESETEYKVIFRSYTGSFVYFYVAKTDGTTRIVEYVPTLDIESETGTIQLFDYIEKN